jgi:isoamylase
VRSAGHTAADALQEGSGDDAGDLHLIFNAHWEALTFQLPQRPGQRWARILDTARPAPGDIGLDSGLPAESSPVVVAPRSTVVLLARDEESFA